MLAHCLPILFVQLRIFVANDLAHAHLGKLFRHDLLVEQTLFNGRLVLNEGGDHLVEIFPTDALRSRALRFRQALNLDLHLSRRGIHADVRALRIITTLAVIEPRRRLRRALFEREFKPGRQHLFHQQAGGNGFQRIVHGIGHHLRLGIRLGDQVGEPRLGLARRIARGAADDLHYLGQAGAVTDGQGVLAPDPVEALFRHPQGDDDVHEIPVVLGLRAL